ncbi:spinster family MFS transporter [Caulobacter vibrioides]|uniref:Major facilitator family transporter n=2 Tax=Caulobacter vibrioides TaxID=155892 RepID=Q9A5G5_CAUVC|nr:MFS transporter [Caulobacter vibrioides]YP_002517943.1 major facilitator superfamily transporter [Caulobacter vibrioides NA1000]AAK24456.1 major facilitator family transporter [Caulobacter vibrioides CB15]ACL96035.1 major facilitator superfamily transporter [Caulobacter vibrioides NA1000]ATC29338.1 MFS transporter [Caulobacter vibrioides]QXZ50851.1 MFS transporter [Caulobacter vibrioides]
MAQPATPSPVIAPVSTAYRRYALWVLLIIYTLNFLDRQVVNILAEPIKRDLGLADWQLGMMTGLAFAIFYTVLGIPIARMAETKNRPYIIGISVAVWSAFTVVCGFAQNFWQLILARIGVGVGEAGCTPPAHSLISDYVPKEKRASAIAFYSIGTPLGTLAGMAMGGLVADAYGWRVAFMVAGAPGLLFALIAAFTLVEPRKKLAAEMAARASTQISFAAALAVLATKKTFWLVALAASIKAFIGYGYAPFIASFFFRVHGPEIAQLAGTFGLKSAGFLGLALGLINGTAGVIGAWLGGVLADRLGAKDLRAYVTVPAIASVVTIPIFVVAMSLDAPMAAIGLLSVNALLATLWYGPVYATAQSIVDPALRATASAVLLLIINLIGLGFGPLIVGLLSDILAGPVGLGEAQGVRWALIISATLGLGAFALFWAARKTIRDEMVS